MRPLLLSAFLIVAAAVAFFLGVSMAPAPSSMAASVAGADSPDVPAADRPVVLVELFTSQGCSSCPPADKMLSMLAEDEHRQVVPLSFHVDYWNRLGWRDPFSSAAWSERQRLYNEALGTGRIYTPQLVVDGADHCVGSDAAAVHRLLEQAGRRADTVQLELGVERRGRSLVVSLAAEAMAEEGASVRRLEPLEVWVALAESGLETSVKTGENARRTLHNDYVVRLLERAFSLTLDAPSGSGRLKLTVPEGVDLSKAQVVAFAQESEGRRIHGAAVRPAG